MDGPLSVAVEGLGEDSLDGSTRRKVQEQREQLQAAVLAKALENHHDQQARPVWVYPQLYKLSSSWILALPGPTNGLSSQVFTEAMAAHLALPSPACQDRLGEPLGVGGKKVDLIWR